MTLSRRNFLVATSSVPFIAAPKLSAQNKAVRNPIAEAAKKPIPQIPPLEPVPGPARLLSGPMIGHLSDREANIWIQSTRPTPWSIELSSSADFSNSMRLKGDSTKNEDFLTSSILIKDLSPSTQYYYKIWFEDREVTTSQNASFTTAPPLNDRGRIRIGFSSCVGRLPEDSSAAFGEIADRSNFDLFLMLGDNHYGDTTDLSKQRLYYTAHRKISGFHDLAAKRPIYAIWDDHDFGPNNSDGTEEHKANSLQAFREFWRNPVREEHPDDPAIYYKFERSGVAFFMLDVRWHRSPNQAKDGPEKTMLGATQLAWLKDQLKTCTAPIKILASGSEWQTHGHKDSWTSFDYERTQLFDWIEKEGIQGVIFISGDRHFCAGYHIRNRWPEFTSGPLGSPNERNAKAVVAEETFTLHYNGKMWMVLDIDTSFTTPRVVYEIWEAGEGLVETQVLPPEVVKSDKFTIPRSEFVTEIWKLKKEI